MRINSSKVKKIHDKPIKMFLFEIQLKIDIDETYNMKIFKFVMLLSLVMIAGICLCLYFKNVIVLYACSFPLFLFSIVWLIFAIFLFFFENEYVKYHDEYIEQINKKE